MQIVLNFFKNLIGIFSTMKFPVDYIDIIIVAVIVYYLIKFARDTRVGHLIRGVLLVLVLYEVAILFKFSALSYILRNTIQISFIAVIIMFQPELRAGLERIGRVSFGTFRNIPARSRGDYNKTATAMISAVCESCKILSEKSIGALIVFEQSVKLNEILDTGVEVDAAATPQTIVTIFFPKTPLHDGAVVIRENKIASAACLLPLSQNLEISKELGTRHRAAVGVTEASDALAVVVSEETGKISYCVDGVIHIGVSEDKLRSVLKEKLLVPEKRKLFGGFRKEGVNDEE